MMISSPVGGLNGLQEHDRIHRSTTTIAAASDVKFPQYLMIFETVYGVWDYWDGIRSGFADYHGVPHYFAAEWDESDDDYLNTFTLRRVDASTIALVQERERIFEDWQWAAHRGDVPEQSHPALPGQNARFAELTAAIQARIESAPIVATGVIGTFKADEDQAEKPLGVFRTVRVQWSRDQQGL